MRFDFNKFIPAKHIHSFSIPFEQSTQRLISNSALEHQLLDTFWACGTLSATHAFILWPMGYCYEAVCSLYVDLLLNY